MERTEGSAGTPGTGAGQQSYDLCIREGFRLRLAEARLTLDDAGLSYLLDGAMVERRHADLVGVRMQSAFAGRHAPWESILVLTFRDGAELTVSSTAPWGGDDRTRDAAYVAFVQDLHRRLLPHANHIRFRRGGPENRRWLTHLAVALFVVMFGGSALFIFGLILTGDAPALEGLGILAGIGGFGVLMARLVSRSKPGPYDPASIPRDLFPE